MRLTRKELFTPFGLTCSKCGGEATAYPTANGVGFVYCPCTSPAWLRSFGESCAKQLQKGA